MTFVHNPKFSDKKLEELYYLADRKIASNEYTEAICLLNKILLDDMTVPEVFEDLAECHMMLDDTDKIHIPATFAMKLRARSPIAFYWKGIYYNHKDRNGAASHCFKMADRMLGRPNVDFLRLWGNVEYLRGNKDFGIQLVERAHRIFPSQIDPLMDLAVMCHDEGDKNKSNMYYFLASRIDKNNEYMASLRERLNVQPEPKQM